MRAEEKDIIISFHSYKGGTGKTLLSVNLATILASKGKKTCLLDFDFNAPSLSSIFQKNDEKYWLNDYLNKTCNIERVLNCCSNIIDMKGNLYVGLANPSTQAIREMTSKDRKWQMQSLNKILSLKNDLFDKLSFDYLIFDTGPGLQYSSINAIFASNASFVVTSIEQSDLKGTHIMIEDLYQHFNNEIEIILNKFPPDFYNSKNPKAFADFLGEPVKMAIPCFCDLLNSDGEFFFVFNYPDHAFSKNLYELAEKIEEQNLNFCKGS